MTRNILFMSTTVAALLTASLGNAQSASGQDDTNPNSGSAGSETVVGSTPNVASDSESEQLNNERRSIGVAEYDPTRMAMPEAEYNALMAAVGGDFETSDGMQLGTVNSIDFDGQGNPELSVGLLEDNKFQAETLVLTLLPDSVMLDGNKIVISTTADDLYLAASSATDRGDGNTVTVNIN